MWPCRPQLVGALCLLMMGAGSDPPAVQQADAFAALLQAHRFEKAADVFYYQPDYAPARLAREKATAAQWLESLFNVAGDLTEQTRGLQPGTTTWWEFGFSATDGPKWPADVGADASETVHYDAQTAKEGKVQVVLLFVHVKDGWRVLRFDFHLPRYSGSPTHLEDFARKVIAGCQLFSSRPPALLPALGKERRERFTAYLRGPERRTLGRHSQLTVTTPPPVGTADTQMPARHGHRRSNTCPAVSEPLGTLRMVLAAEAAPSVAHNMSKRKPAGFRVVRNPELITLTYQLACPDGNHVDLASTRQELVAAEEEVTAARGAGARPGRQRGQGAAARPCQLRDHGRRLPGMLNKDPDRAREILRRLLGVVKIVRAKTGLYAEFSVSPGQLLELAGSNGSGGRI